MPSSAINMIGIFNTLNLNRGNDFDPSDSSFLFFRFSFILDINYTKGSNRHDFE